MAKILDMPKLSPTMEEGVLATWHKKEGDSVDIDDLLAEVETDKATMEFRAFDKGTLLKLLVEPGATVKLGQAVAILGDKGEDVSKLVAEAGGGGGGGSEPAESKDSGDEEPEEEEEESEEDESSDEGDDEEAEEKPAKDEKPAPKKKAAPKQDDAEKSAKKDDAEKSAKKDDAEKPAKKDDAEKPAKKDDAPKAAKKEAAPAKPREKGDILTRTERDAEESDDAPASTSRPLASPYVRKLAREKGIDLTKVKGSGENGRFVPADLEKAPASSGDAPATPAPKAAAPAASGAGLAEPEVRKLTPMRKTIARRLTQSKQTVPHFYLTIDVDAGELVALREKINGELATAAKKDAKPEKISINDLLVKAVAGALVAVPECNATFTEEAILIHRRVDISVAVAIPDGLVTPVVRNADRKSVVAIAREVRDLAGRAKEKKLKPEEMSDGTFSISNLGMFGIDAFSAVINPPEGAILAVGQTRDEPIVKDGQIVAGKKLALTLSCDHRVVDGAVGAAFLAALRGLLEHPFRILTG